MITVDNIFQEINRIAPFSLAAKYDNSGMLTGCKSTEVTKVMLCLDITKEVAHEAVEKGVQLVISHHPVIFNPLYTIGNENPAFILAKNNIAAICAHTNLDMAHGGVNDIMVQKLGFKVINETIETAHEFPYYQLAVYVPNENVNEVYEAMVDAGAGELGDYRACAFSTEGIGNFMPLEGSHAYIGKVGKLESVKETRLEVMVPYFKKEQVVDAMMKIHPYEVPAYFLAQNHAIVEKLGYGKLCELYSEVTAKQLAERIKKAFGNTVVRYNDTKKMIKKVALCSGSGGNLVHKVIAMGADAYICGEVKHDQFIDAQNAGLAVFDAGHYHTENIVLEYLEKIIKNKFSEVFVSVATSNRDILSYEFLKGMVK